MQRRHRGCARRFGRAPAVLGSRRDALATHISDHGTAAMLHRKHTHTPSHRHTPTQTPAHNTIRVTNPPICDPPHHAEDVNGILRPATGSTSPDPSHSLLKAPREQIDRRTTRRAGHHLSMMISLFAYSGSLDLYVSNSRLTSFRYSAWYLFNANIEPKYAA